ncbi:pyridoxal phosphate-dependent aminotransferase [Jiella sp. M17.18]|uniref:pyridoxal phosphate-dependent aminotransferase n=1 Tax=Jiella sp. M17.18 TaxID=3234247 RepID=UPI0034DF2F9E
MKRTMLQPGSALAHVRGQVADLETENIALLAERARALEGVITLWYGESDLVTPQFIRDAAKASLDAGETFYVPEMGGRPDLAQALARYQSSLHGREIATTRSTVAPGGMHSLFLGLELILQTGDNAVYIEPQWPNIRHAIHLHGAEARPYSLEHRDGAWRLDLDALFDRCDARTRAIVFSTPANPTGWTASTDELAALLDFSRRTGVWIVSDEMYNRLYFDGACAPSIMAIAEDEDLVLCVNGFSKSWAMTGWRIGWLNHPASVAPAVRAMTQYMNSGTAPFVQAGALAALEGGEDFVRTVVGRCRTGLDIAHDILGRSNRVVLSEPPKGGMYAFFSVDGEASAGELCMKILNEARVGLAPGHMFGEASRQFIRMCVCNDESRIRTACERIAQAF